MLEKRDSSTRVYGFLTLPSYGPTVVLSHDDTGNDSHQASALKCLVEQWLEVSNSFTRTGRPAASSLEAG